MSSNDRLAMQGTIHNKAGPTHCIALKVSTYFDEFEIILLALIGALALLQSSAQVRARFSCICYICRVSRSCVDADICVRYGACGWQFVQVTSHCRWWMWREYEC